MLNPADIRNELQEIVIKELLGPANGPNEVVDEPFVRGRYMLGLLAPKGQSAFPEQMDDAALAGTDTEDGATEGPPSAKAGGMLPSSIGLTFAVTGSVPALRITARWGYYKHTTLEEEQYRSKQKPENYRRVWVREQIEGTSAPLQIKPGRLDWTPSARFEDVTVQGLVRQRGGQWIITLFLVNGQNEPKINKDEAWLFQPELIVTAPDGSAIFQRRPMIHDANDPEAWHMQMLYRNVVEFAVGHGVSVYAEPAPGYLDCAAEIRTVVAPQFDVPQTSQATADAFPVLGTLDLDMRTLAEVPDGKFGERLAPLVAAYDAWIDGLDKLAASPTPDLVEYKAAAADNVATCRGNLARIKAGIELLDANPMAAQAFRFANQAMYLQRIHSLYSDAVAQEKGEVRWEDIDVPTNHTWYMFQVAFILLNLPSLTDVTHPERAVVADPAQADYGSNIADLLWYPTGGGKTESYLGLAAYAIAVRRLQGEVAGRTGAPGVTVLMRYTLRLLTLQQFQRALRSSVPANPSAAPLRRPGVASPSASACGWGARPHPTGRPIPPTWLRSQRQQKAEREGSPHQLTNCPWCGAKMTPPKH